MSGPARSTPIVFNLTVNVSPACAAAFVDFAARLASLIAAPAWPVTSRAEAAAPQVPSAATTPRAPHPANPAATWRTAERAAVVHELWPTTTSTKEIFARCAALPGTPVPNHAQIAKLASALGLHRPTDMPNPFRDGPPAAGWRTPERRQLIQELWPAGVPNREIVERLGALPGAPLPPKVNKHVGIWAWNMGLARPQGTPKPFRKAAPTGLGDALEPEVMLDESDKPPLSVDETPSERDVTPAPVDNLGSVTPADAVAAMPETPAATKSLPAIAPTASAALPTWTPERTALVRREYPLARVRTADLLAQVNALPGASMSEAWLHNYAVTALKLSRRPDAPRQPDPPAPAPAARRAVAREAIESWCASRGWRFERFDIDAVNRRCAGIGHPGFAVLEPSRRGAAL